MKQLLLLLTLLLSLSCFAQEDFTVAEKNSLLWYTIGDDTIFAYRIRTPFCIAKVTSVTDGDTFDCDLNVLDATFHITVRALAFDAPETKTKNAKEKEQGIRAKVQAFALLMDQSVILHPFKKDSFGRWLCDVTLPDGRDFASLMKERGFQKKESY